MNILIVNGSPKKADLSVTCKYVDYVRKHLPEHTYDLLEVGSVIKKLEKDSEAWRIAVEKLRQADIIVWAYPVYYMWVPAQLKRFIELLAERGESGVLVGKYGTALTTSIHFYDHTAHNYIHAISEDYGMRYWNGYSAHMRDLFEASKREQLLLFMKDFFAMAEQKIMFARRYQPLQENRIEHQLACDVTSGPKSGNDPILLITDMVDREGNLQKMIDYFMKSASCDVELVNIHDLDIKGGCIGCMRCSYDAQCMYKDRFSRFLQEKLLPAKKVIFAWQIVDRALSARAKIFYDRSFVLNHRPFMKGKQVGYLVAGPMAQLFNLRQIFEGLTEMGRANMVDVVSDDVAQSKELSALIASMARRITTAAEIQLSRPTTFLGVGGHKIFRDFVYNTPIFRQDHLYYKKHGHYDFPQKERGLKYAARVLRVMAKIPPVRKDIYQNMWQYMVRPLRKIIEKH